MGNGTNKEINSGYRIIKVFSGSPAYKANLTEFVDFIVDISCENNSSFDDNHNNFYSLLLQNEGKEITLKLYNILTQKIRIVSFVPHKNWENADGLFGANVRYEEFLYAHRRALKIEVVQNNSPAKSAGLIEKTDYILGFSQFIFEDSNSLIRYLTAVSKEPAKQLEAIVYNSKNNSIRTLKITPSKNWGGDGLLGCEFGTGALNQLPLIPEEAPLIKLDDFDILDTSRISRKSNESNQKQEAIEENKSDFVSPSIMKENVFFVDESTLDVLPEINLNKSNDDSDFILKEEFAPKEFNSKSVVSFEFDLNEERKENQNSSQNNSAIKPLKSALKPATKGIKLASRFKFEDMIEGDYFTLNKSGRKYSDHESSKKSPSSVPMKIERKISISSKFKASQEDEVVFYFQGIERYKHFDDPVGYLPKYFDTQEIECSNTTVLDKSDNETSKERSLSEAKIEVFDQESKLKPVTKYTFYSKKLNGDYIIKSTDLFEVDDL